MKKLNTLFLLFFVIHSYSQDIDQNITTVPENPESLVGDSIDIQSNTIENLQKSQAQIDKLDAESKKLTNEYKDTIVEYEILNKYDNQLEKITINQAEEIANIKRQIDELDNTNKYVLPLLEKMVISLRELLEIDVPFLADERYARLEELEDILYKANFSTAEKFRKIYEAYQIENEYGRTIEAYSSSIEIDGVNLAAQFFRLGRLNLYYMTPDGDETGYWNKNINEWVHLGGKYADEIDAALKIAYKQAPPDFINLPVQGVEK
jgi:DNA repair exonuclease SbcCD ATPase subunit